MSCHMMDRVRADSVTPTFAAIALFINNCRWAGVPFLLKVRKALNSKRAEIRVQVIQLQQWFGIHTMMSPLCILCSFIGFRADFTAGSLVSILPTFQTTSSSVSSRRSPFTLRAIAKRRVWVSALMIRAWISLITSAKTKNSQMLKNFSF